jgi:hypothetical protein
VTSGTSDSEAGGTAAGPPAHGAEVVTDARGKPIPVDSLYLDEVNVYRPIVTGDVFENVEVPGFAATEPPVLTMVIAHPSGMRSGAALNEYVRAAPVVRDPRLSPKKAATKDR